MNYYKMINEMLISNYGTGIPDNFKRSIGDFFLEINADDIIGLLEYSMTVCDNLEDCMHYFCKCCQARIKLQKNGFHVINPN
jgi:hypothetical protein